MTAGLPAKPVVYCLSYDVLFTADFRKLSDSSCFHIKVTYKAKEHNKKSGK